MAIYKLPSLDKNAPIVMPDGRPHPAFQRFWQNATFVAEAGANQSGSIAALQAAISTINGQITGLTTGKANLASPIFTGDPKAPTPTAGDNDTSIATTAFVQAAVNLRIAKATFTPWGAPTGTETRSTFATYTAPTVSATYDQSEVQAMADHIQVLSERLAALIIDLKS